jgi:trehalose 6-phosphate phosphatase
MEFTSSEAEQRYADLVRVADTAVVGLDFDGVLSPIVDDPAQAVIHPDAAGVLVELAQQVRAIAVITGRPARQALALGGLDEVGAVLAERGRELRIFGQYGNERWSSTQRRIVSPRPPAGLASFERELPRLLRELDLEKAYVEEKGLAVAVHTRRLDDPVAAFDRLLGPVSDLAHRHDLAIEPGKQVIEVRSAGMDKGQAVHILAEEVDAGGFLYCGDDLGDLEAFKAVSALGEQGAVVLNVASASEEENALVQHADLVVDGPDGVLDLLRRFALDAAESRA